MNSIFEDRKLRNRLKSLVEGAEEHLNENSVCEFCGERACGYIVVESKSMCMKCSIKLMDMVENYDICVSNNVYDTLNEGYIKVNTAKIDLEANNFGGNIVQLVKSYGLRCNKSCLDKYQAKGYIWLDKQEIMDGKADKFMQDFDGEFTGKFRAGNANGTGAGVVKSPNPNSTSSVKGSSGVKTVNMSGSKSVIGNESKFSIITGDYTFEIEHSSTANGYSSFEVSERGKFLTNVSVPENDAKDFKSVVNDIIDDMIKKPYLYFEGMSGDDRNVVELEYMGEYVFGFDSNSFNSSGVSFALVKGSLDIDRVVLSKRDMDSWITINNVLKEAVKEAVYKKVPAFDGLDGKIDFLGKKIVADIVSVDDKNCIVMFSTDFASDTITIPVSELKDVSGIYKAFTSNLSRFVRGFKTSYESKINDGKDEVFYRFRLVSTDIKKTLEYDYVIKLNGVPETGKMVVKSAKDDVAKMVDTIVKDVVSKLRNEAGDMGPSTTERMSNKSSKFRLMSELGDDISDKILKSKGIYVNGSEIKNFSIYPDIVATPNGKIKKISLSVELEDIDKSKEMLYVKDIAKSIENNFKGFEKERHELDRDGSLRVVFNLKFKDSNDLVLTSFIESFKLNESWVLNNLHLIEG